MITFQCEGCNHEYTVPDKYIGKKAKCPKCGNVSRIPNIQDQRSKSVIKFLCSHCGQKIRVPQQYAGKECKCPKCQVVCTVPQPEIQNNDIFNNDIFDNDDQIEEVDSDKSAVSNATSVKDDNETEIPPTIKEKSTSLTSYICSHCDVRYMVSQKNLGKELTCIKCGGEIVPNTVVQKSISSSKDSIVHFKCLMCDEDIEAPEALCGRTLLCHNCGCNVEVPAKHRHAANVRAGISGYNPKTRAMPTSRTPQEQNDSLYQIGVVIRYAILTILIIGMFVGILWIFDKVLNVGSSPQDTKREVEVRQIKNEQYRPAQVNYDVVQSNHYDTFDTISEISRIKLPLKGQVKTFESVLWLKNFTNLHDRISIQYASLDSSGKFVKLKLRRTIDASLDDNDEQKYDEEYLFDRNQNVIHVAREDTYSKKELQVFHVYADQRNLLPKYDKSCEIRVYNRNGLLLEITTKEQHVKKYSYNQSGKIDTIIALDSDGKSYFKEEYQYSVNGYSSKSIQYDKYYHIGNKSLIIEKFFDRYGRLIEYKLSDTDTSYTYLKKWEKHIYEAGGTYSAVFYRHYESKTGQYSEISESMGWSQYVIYDDVKVSYSNTKGSLIEEILISKNAKPLTNTKQWSDPKSLYMELHKYSQEGTESLNIGGQINDIRSYYYVLDPQGNVIETRINHKPATTKYTYNYDQNNNWITRHEKTLVSEYNTKQWKEDSRFEYKRKIDYWE